MRAHLLRAQGFALVEWEWWMEGESAKYFATKLENEFDKTEAKDNTLGKR
jgi:hypothetical protein